MERTLLFCLNESILGFLSLASEIDRLEMGYLEAIKKDSSKSLGLSS